MRACQRKGIDVQKVIESKNILDFDNLVVKTDNGVDHIDDYYELLSSHKDSLSICTPLLSINSMDDPVVDPNHIPIADIMQNPNII